MSRPIIDTSNIHEPKNGAFIVNADLEDKPIRAGHLIAAFDLDSTLIKTKSGNKFPKDYNDWIVLAGVGKKLTELYESNYKIVVFTNQAGSSLDINEFAKKIRTIASLISVPLQVFVATEHGYTRKPSIGQFWLLTRNNEGIEIDMKRSFMVGDAAGRPGDFSDSDYKFALNLGLKFYTDVKMLDENLSKPVHPLEIALCFDKFLNDTEVMPIEEQEMIILVGPPASGKSSFAKKFSDYVIVSQDELGTKQKVIKATEKALKDGYSVIIDRKNEYIDDRSIFIELTNEYDVPVRIIWFDIPREIALHLNAYRNITTGKRIPDIVYNKYYSKEKGLQIPTIEEGAVEVIKLQFKIDLSIVKNKSVFFNYLI